MSGDTSDLVDLTRSSSPGSPPPAQSSSSTAKRKAQDAGGTSGKKAKVASLVQLNGRKLVFNQTPYKRTIPLKARMALNMLLAEAHEDGAELNDIPEEHWAVVVMAGHEQTSTTEAAFIKAIRQEISKSQKDVAELLTNELLSPLVSKLFSQVNYGFVPSDLDAGSSKLPAGLQIRVWEAKDLDKYFPAAADVPALITRREEREAAREACVSIARDLDDIEKLELVKGLKDDDDKGKKDDGKGHKDDSKPSSSKAASARSAKKDSTPAPAEAEPSGSPARKSRERSSSVASSRRSTSPVKSTKKFKTVEEEEEADAKRVERDAKKAEREEKKAAKEREEEKKKQTAAKMSQAFAGFFKPAKAKAPVAAAPVAAEAGPSSSKRPKESDFHRQFKPPAQRANVVWAPISHFKASSTTADSAASSSSDVSGWLASDFLSDHLGRHKRKAIRVARSRLSNGLKSAPLYGTVAEKWADYQSAEDPRAVLRELCDSERFPWKTLAFDQQTRPPYCGTWTKKSVAVGPRTPLAQDPIFDYSYDSGDDWEEEEEAGGDDVDDAAQADPEDADSDMAEDDEFDDWLDNTEDPMFEGEQAPDIDGDVPMPFASPTRREAPKPVKKLVPKRVTKLIPRCLGPVWEENIGEAAVDELDDYRIQLLNNAPRSIDPFKYTSSEPVQQFTTTYSDTAVGNYMGVKCLLSVEQVAVSKPAASKSTTTSASSPMPLGDASSSANTAASASASASASSKSSRAPPKVSFPAENLPELLRAIEGSTKIQSDLVSELRGLFEKVATKAAIEAKVREVAVREGKAKDSQWRVKAEAWTAAGITPPARGLAAMLSQAAQAA